MYRKLSLLVIVSIMLTLVLGCGDSKETTGNSPEQVIRYNIGVEPETLDPAKTTGLPEGTIQTALFEGLVRYDAQNKIQPALADSWTVSQDKLTYTFKLKDTKWSNGDPVTAEDFKFAWLRALDPKTASDYAYQLYYIKGAEAYNTESGKKEDVAIKVVDPKTLEVSLNAPTNQFLGLTAFQTFYPLNQKVVEAHPDWDTSPEFFVCNGPFLLEKWERKQKLTLVKNPNYWDEKAVKLQKLEIYTIEDNNTAHTMYKTGQLDFLENTPTQEIPKLKGTPDYKIYPDTSLYFYRLNVTKKPFNEIKVRKALAMAIERQPLVDKVAQAGQKPAFAFVPNGFPESDGTDFREVGGSFFSENVAEAKKLLAEAGYPDGKGFPKTEILINNNDLHVKIAQAIQQMWKKNLGIEVGVVTKEGQVYMKDQHELNYDIARAGWTPDYLDPMTFIDMFVTDGGNNNTGWSSPSYDALVKMANSTGENSIRMKSMHDAESILMKNLPIIPLFFYTNDNLIKPNIKNVVVPPFGVYAEFKWAYVE